ncbi:hypothetical protein OF83DRAFT_1066364 [Amylostereum chailletii]|nr:hypothetical protein OF83DRAFT_1066364 [Amylostereum chailletii]
MTDVLTFYDIPRKLEGSDQTELAWSPNTWKTRYVLNIKKIPYKTVWLEFQDVEGEMKKLGMPATGVKAGQPFYTVPTIYDPSTKKAVTDSQEIVFYLESQYPSAPSLFPPHTRALQTAFIEANPLLGVFFPLIVADIRDQCSSEEAKAYFTETPERWIGRPLEQVVPQGAARAEKLKELEQTLITLGKWIDANGKDATFIAGDDTTPSYADVDVASILIFAKKVVGEQADVWKTIAGVEEGRWAKYVDAFDKYATVV